MSNEVKQISLDEMFPLMEEQLKNGGTVVFNPKGISMRPLIRQGIDRVSLKKPTSPPKKHDIPLYRREDGSFILHRIIKISSDRVYTMCGDNQVVFEQGITDKNIIGVVTGVYKGDRFHSISSFPMRLYCLYAIIRRIYRKSLFGRGINWGLRKCRLKK